MYFKGKNPCCRGVLKGSLTCLALAQELDRQQARKLVKQDTDREMQELQMTVHRINKVLSNEASLLWRCLLSRCLLLRLLAVSSRVSLAGKETRLVSLGLLPKRRASLQRLSVRVSCAHVVRCCGSHITRWHVRRNAWAMRMEGRCVWRRNHRHFLNFEKQATILNVMADAGAVRRGT